MADQPHSRYGVLGDLARWFWQLLPANPILVRVVTTGGKRVRHLWARVFYLLVLFVVLAVAGGSSLGASGSLAELAKKSSNAFMMVSAVQLFLMAFIAPIFTAGAITQEKDANTFHILLTTPLSSAQIVLGSLFSRLYFVWVLLLSGLPIFCITMIYGGVTLAEVRDSLLLSACTGLVTGSLAIAISMVRVGTRNAIFSFFVGVAVYLLGIWAIGVSAFGQLAPPPPPGPVSWLTQQPMRMSWLAPIHPGMALLVVTGATPAPQWSDVAGFGWPASWLLAYPQYGYMVLTTLVSIALIGLSLFFVRRGAKEGESNLMTRLKAIMRRGEGEERRRRPRHVWNNPIAWREAATRASTGGRSVIRWVFLAAGGLAGLVLLIAASNRWWGLTQTGVPQWIVWLVWIELAVVLLFVTSTAATTLTREKESQTIELLLTTPLTSYYIVFGMLRGLVSFVLPLIAVPLSTLLLFMLAAFLRGDGLEGLGWLQALLCTPLLMVAYASLAALIGLRFSLVSKKTVQAVMLSVGLVMLGALILSGCGLVAAAADEHVAAFVYPFAPFAAFKALIWPEALFRAGTTPTPAGVANLRIITLVGTIVAAAAYLGVTYSLYNQLVRSFDMTVRRQSA